MCRQTMTLRLTEKKSQLESNVKHEITSDPRQYKKHPLTTIITTHNSKEMQNLVGAFIGVLWTVDGLWP